MACNICPASTASREDLAERLEDAIRFAYECHSTQVDRAGDPYILHPIRVMQAVAPDEVAMMAAVLHDVMEDCGVRWETLYLRYGPEVANAVQDVTRLKNETYKKFITRVSKAGPLARRIKMADIRDNLTRPIKPEDVAWKLSMQVDRYLPALKELEAYEGQSVPKPGTPDPGVERAD